jgi:hypothetical protein
MTGEIGLLLSAWLATAVILILLFGKGQLDLPLPQEPTGKVSPLKSPPANLVVVQSPNFQSREVAKNDERFAFVARFGIEQAHLVALDFYPELGCVNELPQSFEEVLKRLCAEGGAVGQEIMQFAHHGRAIKTGEALYIVVTRGPMEAEELSLRAFVDRRRFH